jgi:endonuclease/exonuclease/phosphatase family metal-dependent hydrolase
MKKYLLLMILSFSFNSYSKNLKIMQYNVENFFDTTFDRGTEDYTYLPLEKKKAIPEHLSFCQKLDSDYYRRECLYLDWTEENFRKKITNISRVIRSFDESSLGPDIVVLEEVENLNVLNQLVDHGLNQLGYHHRTLIEGDDKRGIDVGLISKYPILSAKRHPLIINEVIIETRGILEVKINVKGKTIVIFGNHWPSQNNPTSLRVASAKLLSNLAAQSKADLILAAGDFNTTDRESPYPYDYLKNFIDAEQKAREVREDLNPGTHSFKGRWSSLDKFFILDSSVLKADFKKFQIIDHSFLMKIDSRNNHFPWRFNHRKGEGFSDHLPVGLEFKMESF